jgi:hypothetical protein
LQSLSRIALDRFCARVLDECRTVVDSTDGSPHDRYLRIFRLIKERDESMAAAFDDLRRATAIQRLAAMILLGVVTDEERGQLGPATRDSAMFLADLRRPRRKGRRAR